MKDLKQQTVRGGFARVAGQAVTFMFRFVFVVVLARLLDPADFGLVAMVTAVTSFYDLFRDCGLSAAAIQQESISEQQRSLLFWINILIGAILVVLCLISAPLLVMFYREPRLFWVTIALSSGFAFSALGAQHAAILQRELRFVSLAVIDTISIMSSLAVAIAMAVAGFSYWSLVVSVLMVPIIAAAGVWIEARWVPSIPGRIAGIGAILHFGGIVTLNNVVSYLTNNIDKIILGRAWGAEPLGLYGRACQLVNIPVAQLIGAVGMVAFPALSRLQCDLPQFKRYFLKGYGLVVGITAPLAFFLFTFSEDIVYVALGPKWMEATDIFRILSPTVVIFGIINPMSWLLLALGRQKRSLSIALVIAPLCITAFIFGLPYGPSGVATAYSAALGLWIVPHILWSLKDTPIRPSELARAIWPPLASSLVATIGSLLAQSRLEHWQPVWRLLFEASLMASIYAFLLLFIFGQKSFYFGLLMHLRARASP